MGFKQLGRIENFLKKNKEWYSRRAVQRELGMNYHTVSACFIYFLEQKKLIKKTRKGIELFMWKRKKRRRSA